MVNPKNRADDSATSLQFLPSISQNQQAPAIGSEELQAQRAQILFTAILKKSLAILGKAKGC